MDLYDHLVDTYEVDEYVLNDALLTPLTLAAHEGFVPFFQHIVSRCAGLIIPQLNRAQRTHTHSTETTHTNRPTHTHRTDSLTCRQCVAYAHVRSCLETYRQCTGGVGMTAVFPG